MPKSKKYTIGIMGNGMVGSTLAKWFTKAFVYDVDPTRATHTLAELNKQTEIVFICVPTPYNKTKKSFDLSLVESAIESLESKKIVVIKSTVLPGTTDSLQKKYPQHIFLFNPEFLTEKTAEQDFLHPDMQLVGYTKKSKSVAKKILALLPSAPVSKIMLAKEAESVKYFRNTFYATKVIFANQFYDFCESQGIDYDQIKDIVKHDPMVGPNHLEIFHQGGRGAGGKCLAKDLAAFRALTNLPLLQKVHILNTRYIRSTSKKTD